MKKKVHFEKGSLNYSKPENRNQSAFLKRNVPTIEGQIKLAKGMFHFSLQHNLYSFSFSNFNQSYIKRFIQSLPVPVLEAEYQDIDAFPANPKESAYILQKYFTSVIQLMESEPQELFRIADEIIEIFKSENVEIQNINAFEHIDSWEEFIDIMNSILQSNDRGKFELLTSALVQYAERCK